MKNEAQEVKKLNAIQSPKELKRAEMAETSRHPILPAPEAISFSAVIQFITGNIWKN